MAHGRLESPNPISIAEVKNLLDSGSGTHADYFGPYEFEGRTEFYLRVTNDSHAAVWLANLHSEEVDLLTNDIGPYEQTTTISADGFGLIVIDTDGAEWEIEVGG